MRFLRTQGFSPKSLAVGVPPQIAKAHSTFSLPSSRLARFEMPHQIPPTLVGAPVRVSRYNLQP